MSRKFSLKILMIWCGIFFLSATLTLGLYLGILQLTGNFHSIIPGELYRSAQISPKDLLHDKDFYHIKTVINLRGKNTGTIWYDNEVAAAAKLGITLIDFPMSARHQLNAARSAELIGIMQNAEKPILIHCKGGADRTGLASALYLAAIKKATEDSSELQMSVLYGHIGLWFLRAYSMNDTFEMLEPSLGYFDS